MTQTQFVTALLSPTTPPPDGLTNPDGSPAQKRFDVYRNNVAVGLSDALEKAFPVVRKIVGAEFFRAMAAVYVRNFPPSSPLMMFYGAEMASFLKGFEPVKGLPYLADVARLELALRQAYHAADAAPIAAEALGSLAPDQLMRTKLRFAPAVKLLGSRFPLYAIYAANTGAASGKIVNEAESVLVTRPQFDPVAQKLTPASAKFVAALLSGETLGASMAACGRDLDLPATLGLLFAQSAIIGME